MISSLPNSATNSADEKCCKGAATELIANCIIVKADRASGPVGLILAAISEPIAKPLARTASAANTKSIHELIIVLLRCIVEQLVHEYVKWRNVNPISRIPKRRC